MIKILFLNIWIFGLFLLVGCSSDSDGQSITKDPITNGDDGSGPHTGVQDSTTAIYRQFFFKGTHNSYSGNLGGMKREGIATQLERGLKFFEFDLFTFYTEILLDTNWQEDADYFSAFTYMDAPHLLTYAKTGGVLKIYKLKDDAQELIYQNNGNPWTEEDRQLNILNHLSGQYLLDYVQSNGILRAYKFNGTELMDMGMENTGIVDAKSYTFVFDQRLFIAFHSVDKGTYEIKEVTIDGGDITLGASLFELESVPANESIYPFEQEDRLYIFRHNMNTVTNYKVETIDSDGTSWSTSDSSLESSNLLLGSIKAVQSNGKFYINSYTANGNVIGSQLVMDNGTPILVYEYNNEVDFLTGAEAMLYPSEKGYGMFLRKGSELQLSSINIGSLVLGHDAPGDEVDLSVDNPTSILLEDWIDYMAQWSANNPNHEPLFIMTELKEYEQWLADAKWQNIIRMMQDKFGGKLRFHSSNGFHNEPLVDQNLIVDGKTLYYMDKSGSKEGGLLGKVVLYIQPNNNITKSEHTNDFLPFGPASVQLHENFLQLKRFRENNKLVSPDWRYPNRYGNNIGAYIDARDDSYISRIFHMQSSQGDGQYDNIRCTDVMFAVSDRPYEGPYLDYVEQQEVKNELDKVVGCD